MLVGWLIRRTEPYLVWWNQSRSSYAIAIDVENMYILCVCIYRTVALLTSALDTWCSCCTFQDCSCVSSFVQVHSSKSGRLNKWSALVYQRCHCLRAIHSLRSFQSLSNLKIHHAFAKNYLLAKDPRFLSTDEYKLWNCMGQSAYYWSQSHTKILCILTILVLAVDWSPDSWCFLTGVQPL